MYSVLWLRKTNRRDNLQEGLIDEPSDFVFLFPINTCNSGYTHCQL